MKKAFCFDYFSISQSKSKFFLVWFEFFPSYFSKKKEISETYLGLGIQPRPQKMKLFFISFMKRNIFYFKTILDWIHRYIDTWFEIRKSQRGVLKNRKKLLCLCAKIHLDDGKFNLSRLKSLRTLWKPEKRN